MARREGAATICTDCGGPMVEGARFCSFCGRRISRVPEGEGIHGPARGPQGKAATPTDAATAGRVAYPEAPTAIEEDRDVIKKICVIGDSGVGKKTLVGKIAPFQRDVVRYTETIGTAVTKYLLTYGSLRLLIIVWDITGKEP